MNSKERIKCILAREPVDRIGLYEHFWGDTLKQWRAQGCIGDNEDLADHFGFDLSGCGCFKLTARLDLTPETLEETDETIVQRDGNLAVMRRHKLHNTTPEHIDFAVKERPAWESLIKPFLTPTIDRINLDAYRDARRHANTRERFFCWAGVNVFESMHPVCGHEHMLAGMALDPDWIRDMAETYADLIIELMRLLFAREGKPDGIWFYEDMGFKERPFMSPQMYRDILMPAHRRTIQFCHDQGLPVIMHSCGFIEPLLPDMIEAGIDCLQVMENKAGMDPLRIKQRFGTRIALCGGLDARNLQQNRIAAIDAELQAKIPVLKQGSGYILHSDHSIPTSTRYETYRHFVDEGLRLGAFA